MDSFFGQPLWNQQTAMVYKNMSSIRSQMRWFSRYVCVCWFAHRYKEAFPITRYQSLVSPSPHLEAALNKIEVLPKILNRTPAGCRPVGAYSSLSSSMAVGPAMRATHASPNPLIVPTKIGGHRIHVSSLHPYKSERLVYWQCNWLYAACAHQYSGQ